MFFLFTISEDLRRKFGTFHLVFRFVAYDIISPHSSGILSSATNVLFPLYCSDCKQPCASFSNPLTEPIQDTKSTRVILYSREFQSYSSQSLLIMMQSRTWFYGSISGKLL